jgi:catechol 2,3-dioxygenase-like lactoylglutathione lyase family enzyme
MSERKDGIQRRSLLQKVLGGSLLGATGLAGLLTHTASAAEATPVTTPVIVNIGIAVADLEKSTKFYTEVFGYKATAKPLKIGAALAGLLEAEGLDVTIQFIETGGSRIELLAFSTPKVTGDGARRLMYQRGLTHLQIKVPDVKAAVAAVSKAGGTVLENTRLMRGDVTNAIFVLDPDGTRLELVP